MPVFLFVLGALAAVDTLLSKTSMIIPFNMAVISIADGIRLHMPWLTGPMIVVTYLGSGWFLFLFVPLLAIWIAIHRSKGDALWLILLAVATHFAGITIKLLVQSPRPHLIAPPASLDPFSGFGFPSGHSMMSLVVWGSVALLAVQYAKSRELREISVLVCAAVIVAVGFSRIYLGAHWPNDVLGGYLYGGCMLVGAQLLRGKVGAGRRKLAR